MERQKKVLLIFVDGLQYDLALEKMKLLKNNKSSSITPGIGFSNNLYPEMLCGTNPDDIGYFNEWSPKKNINKRLPYYLRILDGLRNLLYVNVGIRRIILRNIFKKDFSNIPFKYAHFFKPQGSHNFRDLEGNNLLYKYDFEIYDSVETTLGVGKRDFHIIDELDKDLSQNNYLLSLVDLDNLAHIYGTKSTQFLGHIDSLDQKLKVLSDKFISFNDDNEVYLFSDHGMVDVSKIVDLGTILENRFGEMSKDKYLYFVDSTYLRIWVKDIELIQSFNEFLSLQEFGKIVSNEERIEFGLTNKDFGDIVFRGNEGVMFAPNFYGARPCKSMHGYDSYLNSQKAIFSKIDNKDLTNKLPTKSKEIFHFLTNTLSN